MDLTFRRFVHEDLEVFKQSPWYYEGMPIAVAMLRQLEDEVNRFLTRWKLHTQRERHPYDQASHATEYVIDMSLCPEVPKGTHDEVSEWVQETFYDKGGMSGAFEVGDFDFEEHRKHMKQVMVVPVTVVDHIRIERHCFVYASRREMNSLSTAERYAKLKKLCHDAAEKFSPYQIIGEKLESKELVSFDFDIDWSEVSEADPGKRPTPSSRWKNK